jgi:hypothetical protein
MPDTHVLDGEICDQSTNVRASEAHLDRASKRRSAPRLLTPAIYLGLALAVAGPLLGSGLVLAVDLSQTPHPGIPTAYWGLPEGTHEGSLARLPLDALFVALGQIDAVAIGQKLMLLAIVFGAGFGMHRLAPARTRAGALFAGFLYAVNPFVYDRLFTGQWFLLLGYALIPHAYRAFLQVLAGRRLAPWLFGALFVATGIASTHMAALLLAMCAVTTIAWAPRIRARPGLGRSLAGAFALALAPSLYWLIPTPGIEEFWRHIGASQLALYRTVADPHWGLAPTVAGLYGYWNDAAPIKHYLPVWPLLALALVVLAAWGAALRRHDPTTWAVVAIGALGFALALGDASFLTRGAYTWLLDHVSVMRSFREPQKGVALICFAYAFLGAAAVDDLVRNAPGPRRLAPLLAALVVALPLLYGFRMLGGLWGGLETSRFPSSWEQADARLKREAAGSRTLFLPWHGYFALAFAHHRVVANPAPAFFSTPILSSSSVGDSDVADQSDPVERYVSGLLDRGTRRPDIGACLAPLGVTHVLVAKEADWQRYRFLDRSSDLVAVQRWPDMVLYRSRLPAGPVMASSGGGAGGGGDGGGRCDASLRPLPARRLSPVRYRLAATPPRGSRLVLGLRQPSDWRVEGRDVTFAPWSSYRRDYLLGLAGAAGFLLSLVLWRRRSRSR